MAVRRRVQLAWKHLRETEARPCRAGGLREITEDVEDLPLGAAIEVQGSRPLSRIDPDALDAYGLRLAAGEVLPGAGDVVALGPPARPVVPVRDHAAIMSRESARRSPSTAPSPASPPSVLDHSSASRTSARSSCSSS